MNEPCHQRSLALLSFATAASSELRRRELLDVLSSNRSPWVCSNSSFGIFRGLTVDGRSASPSDLPPLPPQPQGEVS
jgi:hypothetical protein